MSRERNPVTNSRDAAKPCRPAWTMISWTRSRPRNVEFKRAPESRAETGEGASEWASGSQAWSGATPIFVPNPTRMKEKAIFSQNGLISPARRPRSEKNSEPMLWLADRQEDDADEGQGDADRTDEDVFPGRLERGFPLLEIDQEGARQGRGLDEDPEEGQVAGQDDAGHGHDEDQHFGRVDGFLAGRQSPLPEIEEAVDGGRRRGPGP